MYDQLKFELRNRWPALKFELRNRWLARVSLMYGRSRKAELKA